MSEASSENAEPFDSIPLMAIPTPGAPPTTVLVADPSYASTWTRLLSSENAKDRELALSMIERDATTFTELTQQGGGTQMRNILQCACSIDNASEATLAVLRIFEFADGFEYSFEEMYDFVNYCSPGDQVALHTAISKRYRNVVKELILHGADVNLGTLKKGKDAMYHIYEFQNLMVDLFDNNISLKRDEQYPNSDMLWSLHCDFTPITGVKTRADADNFPLRETRNLSAVLRNRNVNLSDILLHRLVRVFLHQKGERFKWLIWTSVAFHVIWSLLSVLFIVGRTKFPQYATMETTDNDTCHGYEMPFSLENASLSSVLYSLAVIFNIAVFIKETLEVVTCPSRTYYLKQYENVGQWILLLVFLLAATAPWFIHTEMGKSWLHSAASIIYTIGIIIALLLTQAQLSKLDSLGIYNQMLIRSFNRFLYFFVAFLPILLSFMFTFWILLSQKSVFEFDNGVGLLTKILAMMSGELNYDDVFHPDEPFCIPQPIGAKIVFLCFIVVVAILLQNLWIGVTVDDVKLLKDECLASHLASRLEVIYLLEHFLTTNFVLRVLKLFKKDDILLGLCVGPASISGSATDGIGSDVIRMYNLPNGLRKNIKDYYQDN